MAVRSANYLKTRFLPGSVPTSATFSDIIDSAYSHEAQALVSAIDEPGFIYVDNGEFSSVGGGVFKSILETFTTASLVSMFNLADANVYVSADYAIEGTAGVSADGTLATGIQVMLDGSATPGWVTAFNRITTDTHGRIATTSLELSDYGFSYFTSIKSSAAYITVLHPDMASARAVVVHVSCFSNMSADAPAIRFISSTADTINVDYTSTNISVPATSVYYHVDTDIHLRGSSDIGINDTSSYDVTMYPMPNTKGGFIHWATYDVSGSAYNIGYGSMTTNADTTVRGFRMKFSGGSLLNGAGAIRIAVV